MKIYLKCLAVSAVLVGLIIFGANLVFGAPNYTIQRTIIPEANNTYDLGTSTKVWANIYGGNYFGDGSNLTGITGSGGATTTINSVQGPTFTFSSPLSTLNITSSTGNIFFDFGSMLISQFTNDSGYIATTTGNWLGTWQSKNPSDFLSSSTPTGITSLNGSTSSTQTFSSANTLLNIGTSGGIHTFTATTTPSFSTINVSATSTFPSGIWSSNGNVGIGTTTPATKLSVVGTSTFDGNVGIGKTPTVKLDVGGQFNVSATSTFSGNVVVNTGVAGTSTLSIGQSTNPACIEARDNDDGAFTYITFRDGYMYVNEGQCP